MQYARLGHFPLRPIVSAALLLTASAAVYANPTVYTLGNGLPVWDVAAEDLNGDGLKDLLLFACDETSHPLQKEVAVFLASGDGQYPAEPSHVLPLDPKFATAFFAETDGQAPRELIAVHARGAAVFRFENGGFRLESEPEFVSLYPTGSKNPIFLPNGAADMNGDGIDEWLVPVPEGYELRHGEKVIARVNCDMYSELRRSSSVYVYHRFPALLPYDIPGSTTKGLAMLSDEFADFAHGEGWKEHWRFKIPVNLEEKWEASSRMEDINNDGFPDLIVTQTRGTAKLEAQTQIYVANGPYDYPSEPTATFLVKGSLVSPVILDINGDGKKDIIIINIPFGVKNIVNFFVRGKVAVNVDFYPFAEETYPAKPAFGTSVTMDAPEGREQTAYTMGDFNGDGHIDVAFSQTADKFSIFFGTEKDLLTNSPAHVVNIPSFGQARAAHLRGEARQDIVLFHPGGKHSKRVDVIMID
ncbi:MAG: VCBS repeat-containing protein [Candidatus Hydrogenedentes bacterium]|nr:VCBS repeat-containing protein [Candidatus Hydrogenedentota bacterium]